RIVEPAPGLTSPAMGARRVAEHLAQQRLHGRDGLGAHGRGGRVVEVGAGHRAPGYGDEGVGLPGPPCPPRREAGGSRHTTDGRRRTADGTGGGRSHRRTVRAGPATLSSWTGTTPRRTATASPTSTTTGTARSP